MSNQENSIIEALDSLPEIVDASLLSKLTGLGLARIYCRGTEQKKLRKSPDPQEQLRAETLLPQSVKIPGSNRLAFTKTAVIQWFVSNQEKKVSAA